MWKLGCVLWKYYHLLLVVDWQIVCCKGLIVMRILRKWVNQLNWVLRLPLWYVQSRVWETLVNNKDYWNYIGWDNSRLCWMVYLPNTCEEGEWKICPKDELSWWMDWVITSSNDWDHSLRKMDEKFFRPKEWSMHLYEVWPFTTIIPMWDPHQGLSIVKRKWKHFVVGP